MKPAQKNSRPIIRQKNHMESIESKNKLNLQGADKNLPMLTLIQSPSSLDKVLATMIILEMSA